MRDLRLKSKACALVFVFTSAIGTSIGQFSNDMQAPYRAPVSDQKSIKDNHQQCSRLIWSDKELKKTVGFVTEFDENPVSKHMSRAAANEMMLVRNAVLESRDTHTDDVQKHLQLLHPEKYREMNAVFEECKETRSQELGLELK